MATVYSDAYVLAQNNTTYIPRATNTNRRGGNASGYFTITAPVLAATDVIKVTPAPLGAKLARLLITNTDLDTGTTVTIAVGLTSSTAAYVTSGSTIFQSAATTAMTDAKMMAQPAALAGDELIITIVAGPSTTAGTINVYVEWYQP